MARKPQQPEQSPLQPSEVAPEVTVTDSNESASPVTKPAPKPTKVVEYPNGVTIETY